MNSATKATVSAIGTLMAIAGVEHGVGEILQGNVAPAGLMFPSWPNAAFFRIVAGEPAMSIIPNLLVTGILSIFFSMLYLLWATIFVQRKNGGLVLIVLSITMLLVGGGIFPPVFGAIIGVLGMSVNAPLTWWRTHLSNGSRRFLGKLWLWFFVACVIGWLALFPGINIFGYFFGVDDPTLTVILIIFAFGSLLLTIVTGFARDSNQPEMEKML